MARILVVDDEHNIRMMIRLVLRKEGHEVVEASDGPEGLEVFGDGSEFDLVLLDQRMPGMEGVEVLREIKKVRADARVIMITAFGTVDLALEAAGAGAADFLRKPFTTEVLRSAVASALDSTGAPTLKAERAPFSMVAVNGFRILAAENSGVLTDGNRKFTFQVKSAQTGGNECTVVLPTYFVELVKAHSDRENLEDDERFWEWLSEEALANYLWQNAEAPPGGTLQVDELTTGLRRWVDAVLS